MNIIKGGVTAAKGFKAAGCEAQIKYKNGKKDMALVYSEKPIIKVPEGQWYFSVEGASGEFGVYLDSKGDKSPYRMKMRPMGLTLTGALDPMLRGQKIADLITTGAAIDFVIPDIDR